jgi:hypothetical protein
MPSASAGAADRFAWLRSQGLGLACGGAVVVLLAVGSVVLTATRDGASAAVGMDDLRGFFAPPSWVHLWLYLLFPVAALYALNTVLATWDTVTTRWHAGVRAPSAYAASLVHVGFLLALVAHGVGGFWNEDRGQVLLTSGWQRVAGLGDVRLSSLSVEALPGGMPKTARAEVEVRGDDGAVRRDVIGYNDPLSAGGGARLALLADLGRTWVAHFTWAGEQCAAAEGQGCGAGAARVEVQQLLAAPGAGGVVVAAVGGPPRWLAAGDKVTLGGRALELDRLGVEDAIVVRVRSAPGNPWALAASIVLCAGIALMWRRFMPRRAAAAEGAAAGAGAVAPTA